MITAAGITAPILAAAGTVNPIVGAFACCGGSLLFSYFNDSFFWVVKVNFHSKCKIQGGVAEFLSKAFLCRFPPGTFPGRLPG